MAEPQPETAEQRRARAQFEAEASLRESWILAEAGVGRRLVRLTIDPRLLPREVFTWAERAGEGGSMILAGPPGSGKTVAAVAAMRLDARRCVTFESWRKTRPRVAYRLCYAKAVELYRAVFERNAARLEAARAADLLVLDDWGAAYEHDWPVSELEAILDRRWEDARPTVVTTNLQPEQGEDSLRARLPRSFDRLAGEPGPGVVILDRPSLRRHGAADPPRPKVARIDAAAGMERE